MIRSSCKPNRANVGRTFWRLEGGVIGRIDDALIIRGVNVYPSTIENIIRRFAEIGEFAVDVHRRGTLDEMEIRIQTSGTDPDMTAQTVARAVRESLGLRVVVQPVPHGTLPNFELKARRFTDHRRN